MDTLLYWKFHSLLKTDEDAKRVGEICDDFHCYGIDDFVRMYVVLLFYFPLEGGLKKAFDKATTLSEQIGIASRHLIKVAKKVGVPKLMIDRYAKTKDMRNFWVEHGTETMKRMHDEVEELKRKSNNYDNTMERLYDIGVSHTRAKTRRDSYKFFLNKLTYDLIKEVILRKQNSTG